MTKNAKGLARYPIWPYDVIKFFLLLTEGVMRGRPLGESYVRHRKDLNGGTAAFLFATQTELARLGPAEKSKAELEQEQVTLLIEKLREPEVLNVTINLLARKQPKGKICLTFFDCYGINVSTKKFLEVVEQEKKYRDDNIAASVSTGMDVSNVPPGVPSKTPDSDCDMEHYLFIRFSNSRPRDRLCDNLWKAGFHRFPGTDAQTWVGRGDIDDILKMVRGCDGCVFKETGFGYEFCADGSTKFVNIKDHLNKDDADDDESEDDAGDDAAPVENAVDSDADVPHETAPAPSVDAYNLQSEKSIETDAETVNVVAENDVHDDDSAGHAETDAIEDSADEIATSNEDDRDLTEAEIEAIFKAAKLTVKVAINNEFKPHTRVSGELGLNSAVLDALKFKPEYRPKTGAPSRTYWDGDIHQNLARALRKAA